MFKSKHSGWTWDLKRTPFGGGGGAWYDPGTWVQGASDSLASADPQVLQGTGDFLIENGWMLPVAMATAGAGMAALGGEAAVGGLTATESATAAGSTAYADAIAAGATTADATAAGNLAAQTALDAAAGTGGVGAGAAGSGLGSTIDSTLGGSGAAGGTGLTSGATGASGGMSAQLAPGTILGTGAPGGGAIGSSYAAGANGLPATDFFGNYIPASSINFGGVPNTVAGTSVTSDTLNTLNNVKKGTDAAKNLSKMLSQGSASGLSSSLGQLAQGANPQGMAMPNLVRGNQNPFTYTAQQPIQNAQPMDLSALSKLLKQG